MGRKVPFDQVGGHAIRRIAHRRSGPLAATDAPDAFLTHYARHALAAYLHSVFGQFSMDAGSTVGAVRCDMDLFYASGEHLVLRAARRGSSPIPGIETAAGDPQHSA
jgi:hypothetical protein